MSLFLNLKPVFYPKGRIDVLSLNELRGPSGHQTHVGLGYRTFRSLKFLLKLESSRAKNILFRYDFWCKAQFFDDQEVGCVQQQ